MNYARQTRVEIDLGRAKNNLSFIKNKISPQTEIMAIVKAEAYGHGAIKLSRAFIEAGATRLGVALLEEGIKLRKNGIDLPIHILTEIPDDGIQDLISFNLIPTICQKKTLLSTSREAEKDGKTLKIHIKVDTGMNRIGVSLGDAPEFIEQALALKNIEVEGLFTHLAAADNPENDLTMQQLKKFNNLLRSLEEKGVKVSFVHAANSAGIIYFPQSHYDMVRPGISLYGLAPSGKLGLPQGLEPVLSWKSKISFIKDVPAGEGISYSHTFTTKSQTRIATIPLGYADGYFRLLSNKGEVLIGGKKRKIVGNICMDQFMVELGRDEASVGDDVVLIGSQGHEQITAEEIGNLLGTINYEVVSRISERVPRIYKS